MAMTKWFEIYFLKVYFIRKASAFEKYKHFSFHHTVLLVTEKSLFSNFTLFWGFFNWPLIKSTYPAGCRHMIPNFSTLGASMSPNPGRKFTLPYTRMMPNSKLPNFYKWFETKICFENVTKINILFLVSEFFV